MHEFIQQGDWELEILREREHEGCCHFVMSRSSNKYLAEIRLEEKERDLEILIEAAVFIKNWNQHLENNKSHYSVRRILDEEYCQKIYQVPCKAKASEYLQELRTKIDRRYFPVEEPNLQLELPLKFQSILKYT